jgi:hypothetical protein
MTGPAPSNHNVMANTAGPERCPSALGCSPLTVYPRPDCHAKGQAVRARAGMIAMSWFKEKRWRLHREVSRHSALCD